MSSPSLPERPHVVPSPATDADEPANGGGHGAAPHTIVVGAAPVGAGEGGVEAGASEATPPADGRIARGRAAAASFWASVRPRTRRGGVVATVVIVGAAAALSVVFLAGAITFASLYGEFGSHPAADAARWQAHVPAFGEAALCSSCHQAEYAKATTARHAGIGCESCHGPLLTHALAQNELSSGAAPGGADEALASLADSVGSSETEATGTAGTAIAVPTDEVCIRCHVQAVGRPTGFRQIVIADHYEPVCLQCHDPHTGISRRPPVVQHPIDSSLPPCVTCHGPEGFKARDQRHPDVGEDDAACLACHLPGRGPSEAASR